jgi:hypothetical protein
MKLIATASMFAGFGAAAPVAALALARLPPILCAAAGVGALSAPPQLKELKSNVKRKLRKQRLLRATASSRQIVTTPRRYASRQELVDDYQHITAQINPFHWTELPFRIGSLVVFYLAYPLAWQTVHQLPPPNPTEGGYFFSLMSIVFGTLTASTISDATARLAALRAAAVEECTLMLPLVKRLEVILVLDADAPALGDDVFRAVARRLHAHSCDFVGGGRERELELIAEGHDAFSEVIQILQQAKCSMTDLHDVDFALDGCGRLMEARGIRLSLENSGIPDVQYSVLRTLSLALAVAYTYLTLDRGLLFSGIQPHALGFELVDGLPVFDASFGVHTLFAVVCAALVVFNSLAIDVNLPFSGIFRLESGTVAASLKNLRSATAPYLEEPPAAPSELSALYGPDSED